MQPKLPKLAVVRSAVARAKCNGVDEAEYLDRYGLVLTDAKKAQLHAEMCRKAAELIKQMSIAALVGNAYHSGNWTPADMRDGIVRLLRGMEVEARKGKYISEGDTE